MRLLILNWKHPDDEAAGGAERYVVRVAQEWTALGHEVTLLVPSPGRRASRLAALPREPGLLVLGSRATIFWEARRFLRQAGRSYDGVLESVSTRPFFLHELLGDRVLVLYHQIADDVWPQEFPFPVSWLGRNWLEPRWWRRLHGARVVANSPSTFADLDARGVSCVGIVPPGVDGEVPVARTKTPPAGAPRLLFLGRLVRTKRPMDALAAFAAVRAQFPEATLDVVGSGYLVETVRRSGLPGLRVHGFLRDSLKDELLSQAHLLLLPGTREGWGIVALEAALHGVPTVAYDIPGLRDAVVDGVTGVLCPPDPSDMGKAVLALLGDHGRWSTYSAAARIRARSLTWSRAARALLALLQATPDFRSMSG